VRLVVASLDTMTGKVKDEVVQHLRGGEPIVDPPYGSNTPKHTRYIGKTGTSIPWPKAQITEVLAEAADTLRIQVDEESFFPSVQHLTVPEGLIDELRSKYSRTRRVHTQDYIRQKMAEDAKEQWEKRRRMVLPQQEYWEYKAKQKSKLGGPTVTAETLDLIRNTQAARRGEYSQRMGGPSA
jgi:large subunit ribosomal protein L24